MPLGILGGFGDGVKLIFSPQPSLNAGGDVGGIDVFWGFTKTHLELTFAALAVSLLIALPAGVILGHRGKGEGFAVAVGNMGRAIPELVLIAYVATAIGVGFLNITLALAVLGIPPILTNSFVGMRQVDRGAVEAARGMGMTAAEIIRKVELPLAVPTIMSGVRTAIVNIVATASIAPLAGERTLGTPIVEPNVFGATAGPVAGALCIAVIALSLDFGFAGIQRLLTPDGIRLQRERASLGSA